MTDNKNMLLAIVLSVIVLGAWQFFVGIPQAQRQQHEAQIQAEATKNNPATNPAAGQTGGQPVTPGGQSSAVPTAGGVAPTLASRSAVIASTPRVSIDTPRYLGSIDLKGGRIDDLALKTYHETVDPKSPNIVLLSPSGTPIQPGTHRDATSEGPFYADFGWAADPSANLKLPDADTVWAAKSGGSLTPSAPVVLEWDNGQGLAFTRTIAVDDSQLFTITDAVANKTQAPVKLSPYALVSRHGTPLVAGYYILHEGLIGYLGADGLQEYTYKNIDKEPAPKAWDATGGWLGFTDKYWATTVIPDQNEPYTARFSSAPLGTDRSYQTDFLFQAKTIAPGATGTTVNRLFSGAKEVALLNGYEDSQKIARFDLLIDWGWFYFITKPLFALIDFLYHLFGNFGLAILGVTVILKLLFFPLANKSYDSMSKMKKAQPEMAAIKERFPDDKMKQQQAMMALYKEQKINPLSGCLPMLIQIPVFFALYKVLFITIEMRHQPFFGWIHDLSSPDPTSLFNLFGLLPWTPPAALMIGVWPLVMGLTMFLQMQLNPAPTDPIQAQMFRFMPLIFTFTLSAFPAGLVIYYSWNNTLSIIQQSFIMKRNGVKVELLDNLKSLFGGKKNTPPPPPAAKTGPKTGSAKTQS